MAISVNDILQITDVQTYLDQQMLNVYFFRVDVLGSAVTYEDVADYFQTQIVLPVKAMQSSATTHTFTVIKNLTNGLDIFEDPANLLGESSFEAGPSFVAASFRLLRSTALTRHGAKRIGGLAEEAYNGNGISAAYVGAASTVATALGAPVEVDSAGDLDLTMTPVIVGRYPQGDPNAGQLDLSKINEVASAQFIRISSQVTRRMGRGA